MTELIPYFAGLITVLFSCGFAFAIMESQKNQKK
jgi:hypothetical protein